MTTITTPSVTEYHDWLLSGQDQRSMTQAPDRSMVPLDDWQRATDEEPPSFIYGTTAANMAPEFDQSWLSLARSAQQRWRQENRF